VSDCLLIVFYIFSYDLVVLRELILSVSGLEVETHVTEENLEVQCGGERLQREVRTNSFDHVI